MSSRLRRLLCALLPLWASVAVAAVPAVGTMAPDFTLPDQHGKMRQLSEWRGKWVVLGPAHPDFSRCVAEQKGHAVGAWAPPG